MARVVPLQWAGIERKHRYKAAQALEGLEDWHRGGVRVTVTLGRGKCGKFPGRLRVWVAGGEKDRARRGLVVPPHLTARQYQRLIHGYLAFLVERRLGCSGHVIAPLQ